MQFGMNVVVDSSGEGAASFIRSCAKAELPDRINLQSPAIPKPVLDALQETQLSACWSLLRITSENAERMYEALVKQELDVEYARVAAQIPAGLGIILPEGLHFITRVGQGTGRFGFRKEELMVKLAAMANAIKATGPIRHSVVLPVRAADITGRTWDGLDFDVFEVDTMLSHNLQGQLDNAAVREMLESQGKPLWHGKAGIVGGYHMPTEQARFLRKLRTITTGAKYAFLWSEPGSAKWDWSRDGQFVVDLLPDAFREAASAPAPLASDPALNHWKTQQREREAP